MSQYLRVLAAVACLGLSSALAATKTVTVHQVLGDQTPSVGTITFSDHASGLLIQPDLHSLPPGPHGFHLHQNPSCADHGHAAGGHFDPKQTGAHHGPYATTGHLGDLPLLFVDQAGMASTPILAPHLQVKDILGRSIMIHAHGDNYADDPEKLGGGGARLACGEIKESETPEPETVKK